MDKLGEKKQGAAWSDSNLLFGAFVFLTGAAFIALDLSIASNFDDAWPAIFLMIVVVGQLTLICVWGTLVEGTFWVRLPWTILLLVVSWTALCGGVVLDRGEVTPGEVMGMALVWSYGFAISYIPLKLAAWLFGWRITSGESQLVSNRYAIRDIMFGTALLAATLAIIRYLIPDKLPTLQDAIVTSGLDRPDTLIAFLIFSVVSLVVKLPCIWVALATDKSKVQGHSIIWVFCAGMLGLVEVGLLVVILGDPGPFVFEITASLVFGHAAMAITMLAVLFGLRCFGYQLSRDVVKVKPSQKELPVQKAIADS